MYVCSKNSNKVDKTNVKKNRNRRSRKRLHRTITHKEVHAVMRKTRKRAQIYKLSLSAATANRQHALVVLKATMVIW